MAHFFIEASRAQIPNKKEIQRNRHAQLPPNDYRRAASARMIRRWNVLSPVTQHLRHPNQLVEKHLDAPEKIIVEKFSAFIENHSDVSEINVLENRNQSELAHNGQERFDHSRSAERARRHATNADSLVDVLLKIHIERVLQQSRVTMIVFWRYYDESVAALDRRGELWVFHLFARVIEFHRKLTH